MLLALLLQAATTSASAAPPEHFSILYDACPARQPGGKEVVVCGVDTATAQRLPLPDDAPPTPNYVKPDSGDFHDNKGHYAAPCVARMEGCLVGFGPPVVEWAKAGVQAIRAGAKTRREKEARRRDGDRRVAIPLAGEGPKGRLEP